MGIRASNWLNLKAVILSFSNYAMIYQQATNKTEIEITNSHM